MLAMFAATLLAPAGVAQTNAPDSVPNFSAGTPRLWRASDLKTAVRGRNPVGGFLERKSKSAPKNSFSFSVRRFTLLVWLTCSKRLKRGRIPGGMKPIPWQDRLRSTCTCLLRDRTGDGYRLELD